MHLLDKKIVISLLWIGFLVIHVNILAFIRANRANVLSSTYSMIGAFIYMIWFGFTSIQFLKLHGESYLIMKSSFLLSNFLICLGATLYEDPRNLKND